MSWLSTEQLSLDTGTLPFWIWLQRFWCIWPSHQVKMSMWRGPRLTLYHFPITQPLLFYWKPCPEALIQLSPHFLSFLFWFLNWEKLIMCIAISRGWGSRLPSFPHPLPLPPIFWKFLLNIYLIIMKNNMLLRLWSFQNLLNFFIIYFYTLKIFLFNNLYK